MRRASRPGRAVNPVLLPSSMCGQSQGRTGVAGGSHGAAGLRLILKTPCTSPGLCRAPFKHPLWLPASLRGLPLGPRGSAAKPSTRLPVLAVPPPGLVLLGRGGGGKLCPGLCPCRRGHHIPQPCSCPGCALQGQGWGWAAREAHAPRKTAAGFNAFLNQLTLIASSAAFRTIKSLPAPPWASHLAGVALCSSWRYALPPSLFSASDCLSCYSPSV